MDREAYPLTDDFSKLDVWALAVTLIHMLTHALPFANGGKTII
jgi:serine/threonine protein kinase